MSTETPFGIPQPMIGMNWEPSPSDYTQLPAPQKYGDTDFANYDFPMLWGGWKNKRQDLQTIKDLGCNTIKMYNWSVPAPNGYWKRDHSQFLKKAQEIGLSVIIPISNYFTGVAYNNRTNNSNPAGPPADNALKGWIKEIVTEVYTDKDPGPAIMWAIGNEYDNSENGAYGYCEAQDIATVASYIIDAEKELDIAEKDVLAFASPVTTALTPVNTSIQCSSPLNTLMGGCAIQALIDAFNDCKTPIPMLRFIASVNSYQIGQQLVDYYNKFPTLLPNIPMFYGELGFSAAQAGEQTQAQNIYNQFSTTISQAKPGSFFYGSCCFEYTDELWKGAPGSTEVSFGIYTFAKDGKPTKAHEGLHPPVNGAEYPVDALKERPAKKYFHAAATGQPEPTDCSD